MEKKLWKRLENAKPVQTSDWTVIEPSALWSLRTGADVVFMSMISSNPGKSEHSWSNNFVHFVHFVQVTHCPCHVGTYLTLTSAKALRRSASQPTPEPMGQTVLEPPPSHPIAIPELPGPPAWGAAVVEGSGFLGFSHIPPAIAEVFTVEMLGKVTSVRHRCDATAFLQRSAFLPL